MQGWGRGGNSSWAAQVNAGIRRQQNAARDGGSMVACPSAPRGAARVTRSPLVEGSGRVMAWAEASKEDQGPSAARAAAGASPFLSAGLRPGCLGPAAQGWAALPGVSPLWHQEARSPGRGQTVALGGDAGPSHTETAGGHRSFRRPHVAPPHGPRAASATGAPLAGGARRRKRVPASGGSDVPRRSSQ